MRKRSSVEKQHNRMFMRAISKRIALRCLCLSLILGMGLALTGCMEQGVGGNLTGAGLEALEKNDYATALSDFTQAVQNGEDPVPAYRGEGIALMGLARYEEAADVFRKALEETDDRMPKTVRDISLYRLSALFRAGKYNEVISACEEMPGGEELTEACFYRGAAYLQTDQNEEARKWFDKAVAAAPGDYNLYLRIYEQYESKNLTAIGDEYLQQALRLQPETNEDRYHIGRIRFYLEKYDDARAALMEPVEAKYLPALELMGEIYMAQGDYDHARASYQAVMQEEGESAAMYNGLAMCAIAAGEYDEALSYIETGLALEGDEGEQQLLFNEIVAWEGKLDFAKALEKAEAYHALYPTDELGTKELQFLNTRGK